MENTISRMDVQEKALLQMYSRGEVEEHTVAIKIVNPYDPADKNKDYTRDYTFYKTRAAYTKAPTPLIKAKFKNARLQRSEAEPDTDTESESESEDQ